MSDFHGTNEPENKPENRQEKKQEQRFDNSSAKNSQFGQANDDLLQANNGGQAGKAGRDVTNNKTEVKGTVSGNVFSAKDIVQSLHYGNKNTLNFFVDVDRKIEIEEFSISNTTPIEKEELNRVKELFVYPEDKKKNLISYLSRERILLLTGKAETGKFCTAKYLAGMMQKNEKEYKVLLVAPLERKCSIELRKLIENPTNLKQTILIFVNAFARDNQKLMDFFAYYSREKVEAITRKLEKTDAFILFTADQETVPANLIANSDAVREIVPVPHELMQKGFQLTLKHVCSQAKKWDFEKVWKLFEGDIGTVVKKLDRMSRVSPFFNDYLDKMLFQELAVDEALEAFIDTRKTITGWFLNELGEKKEAFEAWTFTLCMALFNQSSYTFFTDIHRKITNTLLPLFNSFNSRQEFSFMRSESKLLEKAGVQISKNPQTLADTIEFRDSKNQGDSKYQEVLMDILLENSRKALLSLIPLLVEHIEAPHRLHDQRTMLTAGLARIGWIDPQRIIYPLINRWANEKDVYHKINVGYLYKSIMTHDGEAYRKYCLTQLKSLAVAENYDQQLTAIAAYNEIGYHNLEFAMEGLRNIHETVIKRMSKDEEDCMFEYLFSLDSYIDDKKSEDEFVEELTRIYKNTLYLLSNIPHVFVAWAVNVNVMAIFDGLKNWIDKGKTASRRIIVLFVMGNEYEEEYEALEFDGIFKLFEKWEIKYSEVTEDGKKETIRCNPVLHGLSLGEEQVEKMATFLYDIYKKCFTISDMNKLYKRLLFKNLEKWTLGSLFNRQLKNSMEQLIIRFYHAGDDELKDTLWDKINRWKAPKDKEKELDDFVDNVSKKIFNM